MAENLDKYKYHPRILELRLASFKMQLARQYGEEHSMELLQKFAEMFQCNWSLLVGIFNKDNKIINGTTIGAKRKKQEIIFMGNLYNETRYHISKHYLGMSINYLYQLRSEHNPEAFATEEWLEELDSEILICGVRAHANEAKRFIISFDALVGVFK
jgi:hypothetical protein